MIINFYSCGCFLSSSRSFAKTEAHGIATMISYAQHKALHIRGIDYSSAQTRLVSRSEDASSDDNTSSSMSSSDDDEDNLLFHDSLPETWLEKHWYREDMMLQEEKSRQNAENSSARPIVFQRSDTSKEINRTRWRRWRERRRCYEAPEDRLSMVGAEDIKVEPSLDRSSPCPSLTTIATACSSGENVDHVIPIKRIRRAIIETIDIGKLVEEVSSIRPDFSLRFKSHHGLGVNWMIYRGKVYVQSFSPLIVYEDIPIEISGYIVGPIEACGDVHIGDELIRVNDLAFSTLEMIQISDIVQVIDKMAESPKGVELVFRYSENELEFQVLVDRLEKEEAEAHDQRFAGNQSGIFPILFSDNVFERRDLFGNPSLSVTDGNGKQKMTWKDRIAQTITEKHPYPSVARVSALSPMHSTTQDIVDADVLSLAKDLEKYTLSNLIDSYSAYFDQIDHLSTPLLRTPKTVRLLRNHFDDFLAVECTYREEQDEVWHLINHICDSYRDRLMEIQFFPDENLIRVKDGNFDLSVFLKIMDRFKVSQQVLQMKGNISPLIISPTRRITNSSVPRVYSLSALLKHSKSKSPDRLGRSTLLSDFVRENNRSESRKSSSADYSERFNDSILSYHIGRIRGTESGGASGNDTMTTKRALSATSILQDRRIRQLFRKHFMQPNHDKVQSLLSYSPGSWSTNSVDHVEGVLFQLLEQVDDYHHRLIDYNSKFASPTTGSPLVYVLHHESQLSMVLPPIDLTYCIFYALMHLRSVVLLSGSRQLIVKILERWLNLFESSSICEVKKWLIQSKYREAVDRFNKHEENSVQRDILSDNEVPTFQIPMNPILQNTYNGVLNSPELELLIKDMPVLVMFIQHPLSNNYSLTSAPLHDISGYLKVITDLATFFPILKYSNHNRMGDVFISSMHEIDVYCSSCIESSDINDVSEGEYPRNYKAISYNDEHSRVQIGQSIRFHYLPFALNPSCRSSTTHINMKCMRSEDADSKPDEIEDIDVIDASLVQLITNHFGILHSDCLYLLCEKIPCSHALTILTRMFTQYWQYPIQLSTSLVSPFSSIGDNMIVSNEKYEEEALVMNKSISPKQWLFQFQVLFFIKYSFSHHEHYFSLLIAVFNQMIRCGNNVLAIELLVQNFYDVMSPLLVKKVIFALQVSSLVDDLDYHNRTNMELEEKKKRVWWDYLSKLIRSRKSEERVLEECCLRDSNATDHGSIQRIPFEGRTWDIVNEWLSVSLQLALTVARSIDEDQQHQGSVNTGFGRTWSIFSRPHKSFSFAENLSVDSNHSLPKRDGHRLTKLLHSYLMCSKSITRPCSEFQHNRLRAFETCLRFSYLEGLFLIMQAWAEDHDTRTSWHSQPLRECNGTVQAHLITFGQVLISSLVNEWFGCGSMNVLSSASPDRLVALDGSISTNPVVEDWKKYLQYLCGISSKHQDLDTTSIIILIVEKGWLLCQQRIELLVTTNIAWSLAQLEETEHSLVETIFRCILDMSGKTITQQVIQGIGHQNSEQVVSQGIVKSLSLSFYMLLYGDNI